LLFGCYYRKEEEIIMSTENTTQELLQLKKKIENAKTQKSECEGALKQLRKQLHDDFDCENLKEAKTALHNLQTKIENLNDKISTGMQELRKNYDW